MNSREQTGHAMSNDRSGDSLNPKLQKLQDKLESARDEICDIPHVSELSTGELIRVEETLAIAAETAKEAVSIRRKIHLDRENGR